jgi:hypothetical protein
VRAGLRKPAMACLEILCSHDGRETSVFYEPLAEVLTLRAELGVVSLKVKKDALALNYVGAGAGGAGFNVVKPRTARGHVIQHSTAEVRMVMRHANFPFEEFAA